MTARARQRRRRAGVTLAEVVVSVGLFMLGTLGLFAMLGQIRNMSALTAAYNEAHVLAATTIETLRAQRPVESLAGGATTAGQHRVSWTVGAADGYRSRAVRVRVEWNDRGGAAHAATVSSVIASVQ